MSDSKGLFNTRTVTETLWQRMVPVKQRRPTICQRHRGLLYMQTRLNHNLLQLESKPVLFYIFQQVGVVYGFIPTVIYLSQSMLCSRCDLILLPFTVKVIAGRYQPDPLSDRTIIMLFQVMEFIAHYTYHYYTYQRHQSSSIIVVAVGL